MSKIACFPTDEAGRAKIAMFQRSNQVLHGSGGEMVNQGKKEPCVWITYIPPVVEATDPYPEMYPIDDGNTTSKKRKK